MAWAGRSRAGGDLHVWQDREIKFDGNPELLKPREGEVIVDKMMSVEDTKGNNGVEGRLLATTLRLIWKKSNHMYTNLSIGYNCIVSVSPLPNPPSSSPRTAPPGTRARSPPRPAHGSKLQKASRPARPHPPK